MSGLDALCWRATAKVHTKTVHWPGPDAVSQEGCRQAWSMSCYVAQCTQQLSIADIEGLNVGCTISWTSCPCSKRIDVVTSASFDCTCLYGMALSVLKWLLIVLAVSFICFQWLTAVSSAILGFIHIWSM